MPNVVYEMSLKDRFTGPMREANVAAETLHGTMTSLLTTLGIGFGLYKLVDYFKEAREEVEKIHQAEGQLQAGLASTHQAAGMSYEELQQQAEKFSHVFRYTKAEVLDMQSLMLTFPNVTKQNFEGASQAILDMSARLHKGADQVAIMVGKALQDPARGIMSLRRIGVNFDQEHTDRIKKMVAQGHILQAQAAIMKELQTEFAGSAAANAAADPLFAYNKSLEETKEQIGDVVVEIQKQLAPALLYIAERFRDLVDWLKKNGEQLWIIIKALGVAYIAFRVGATVIASYTAFMSAIAPAAEAAAAGTEAVAAASTLALGPMGLLILAAGALAGAYGLVASQVQEADDRIEQANFNKRQGAENAEGDLNTLVKFRQRKYKEDEKTARARVVSFEEKELQKKYNEQMDIVSGKDTHGFVNAKALKEANDKLKEINAQQQGLEQFKAKGPADISKKGVAVLDGEGKTKSETKGAKGNKAVTINIKIDSLNKGGVTVNSVTVKESGPKIQEMFTQWLMGAVNNSQIIAGN